MLPSGKDNAPSRLATEHLSKPPGSVAIVGPIAVVIECLNLIAPELSEARRGRCHLWRVHERDVDTERDTRGAPVHRAAERGLDPDALDGC
jgi:hypothetical protein